MAIGDLPGVCMRGHEMWWDEPYRRYRCNECSVFYAQRRRDKVQP